MENMNLIDTFSEFKELKNIDRTTMMSVLEDVFRSVLQKQFGTDENFDIIINIDKGDFEIWRNREVVEDDKVEDENLQISLSEATKIDEDYEVGEEVTDEVKLIDFGRRTILSLRQNLTSRILDLEKDYVYNKYKDRIGDIITGEVYQVWKREILILDDEGNELIMPKEEQIPSDFFRKGDIPGERAKVAVESYDERIDPVGACVGMKGSRIHGIVRELKNENIDVINYTTNIKLYISRSLSPAKVESIKILDEEERAEVYLQPEEVSLAIGKGGLNIRLAGQLTGYEIDVYRETDTEDAEDVSLEEFADEIESWVLDELKAIGCDTAKIYLIYYILADYL
jgi:N utilization substance protein A